VAVATGIQKDFNWNGVALGALSGRVASEIGAAAGVGAQGANATWLGGSTVAPTVARSMLSNAITQGVAVATGLQDKFSWTNVAAAGFGERLAKSTLSGLAAGAAAAIARGGRVTVQQVAMDAFGNALGESIAQTDWGGMRRQAVSYTPEEQAQDFAREDNRFSSALTNRASDPANLAAAQRYLSMYPMASNDIADPLQASIMSTAGSGLEFTRT